MYLVQSDGYGYSPAGAVEQSTLPTGELVTEKGKVDNISRRPCCQVLIIRTINFYGPGKVSFDFLL